jgi:hypothetical protein
MLHPTKLQLSKFVVLNMATKPDDIEACEASREATKMTESSKAIPLPMKATKSKTKTLDEILALILDLKNVVFDPLPLPNRRKAELRIPEGVDYTDPYALYSLYWPE